jgi:hypothetical protein
LEQHDLTAELEKLSPEVLREGFNLLYREYKNKGNAQAESQVSYRPSEPEIPNFVSLIQYIKSKYNFEELRDLSVEGGRVFFRRGGRKIELSREQEEVLTPPPGPSSEQEESTAETGRFSQLELN